jgi:hypothetical protein
MKPGESYYGVSEFLRDGRVRQTFDPVENFKLFKEEVFSPFLNGEKGSLVVRITRETKIKEFEALIKKSDVELKIYDSSRGTIKDLDDDILRDKDKHCVRIIKQSYKQGMVITNKHLIRGWFDTSSEGKNSASDLQSIGRNFGYDDKMGRYSIAKLKYNIWCNEEDAKRASIYYEQMELLSDGKFDSVNLNKIQMSSTHVHTSSNKITNKAIFNKAFSSFDEAREYLEALGVKYKITRLHDHRKGVTIDYARNYSELGYLQVNLESENIKHVIVDCTKPQLGYEESWEMLAKTGDFIHTPCKGKFAIATLTRVERLSVSNGSMHK